MQGKGVRQWLMCDAICRSNHNDDATSLLMWQVKLAAVSTVHHLYL